MGVVYSAEYGGCVDGRAISAFFRARVEGSQCNSGVIICDSLSETFRVLQRQYGFDHEIPIDREQLGPFDVVMLEIGAFYPAWGDIHLGPDNALKAHAMLGGVFMPVHWGTFSLAMHAWDQPAEILLELAPYTDAQLLMPLLGQPAEPAHAETVKPWWREVDSTTEKPPAGEEGEVAFVPLSTLALGLKAPDRISCEDGRSPLILATVGGLKLRLLLACVALCAWAIPRPSLAVAKQIAIVGVTVVNPEREAKDAAVADATVVISGDRIVAVGSRGSTPVAADAVRIDGRGKWLIPGMIDGHVHFFQSGNLYTRPDVADFNAVMPYAREVARNKARLAVTFRSGLPAA